MEKDLKEKAIDIKGKKYVLVADRILYFNENYELGSITTELLSDPTDNRVVVKATVKPNGDNAFTGHSQAVVGEGMVNKTAALENAETSAVGRALAMMGIGVIESIASADEMTKANVEMQSSDGMICDACKLGAKVSAKSGKLYCPEWKTHQEENEKWNIVKKEEANFIDNIPM